MILKRIHLSHFRNYSDASFEFIEGINYIVGKNAQGKTNLLESIYYLSTTKTHRNVSDEGLIQQNENYFRIDGVLERKQRRTDLRCIVSKQGKHLFVYGNPVKKISDFVGICNAVLFSPDDMNLFAAPPRVRRRFIDIELSKLSKTYLSYLNEYDHLLKERNAYLKNENISLDFISVLNQRMADCQCVILRQRSRFMHDLIELSHQFYQYLSNDQTKLEVVYKTFVDLTLDDEALKQAILNSYDLTFQRDCLCKNTEKGIHKDDFVILMNGNEVNEVASQGQKRTILLAMKVGIVKMIEKIIHDEPLLLLDDVFSELDSERRTTLLKILPKNIQIFITATDFIDEKFDRLVNKIMIETRKEGGM